MNKKFLNSIQKTYEEYSENGPRSNKKIRFAHGNIAEDILSMLPKDKNYKVQALGLTEQEGKTPMVNGHMKNTDILIKQDDDIKGFVEFKSAMSSYKKNKQNYQENMLGECALVKGQPNKSGKIIPVWYISVFPEYIPNLDSNNNITNIEKFDEEDALSYAKISNSVIGKTLIDVSSTYVINPGNLDYLEKTREAGKPLDVGSEEYKKSLKLSYSDIEDIYSDKQVTSYVTNDYETDLKQFVSLVKNIDNTKEVQ